MSLKRELDDPRAPVRRFLDRHLPHTDAARAPWGAALRQVKPIVPAAPADGSPVPTAALGHAVIARTSWAFAPLDHAGLALGAERFAAAGADPEVLDALRATLAGPVPGPLRAARLAWSAGLLDRAHRTGRADDPSAVHLLAATDLEALVDDVPEPWVRDIATVADLAGDALESLADPAARIRVPMPGTARFGGAEADLIASGTLVDLSATASPKARARDLEVLVVLALLDHDDAFGLTDIAMAPLRFGALVQWDLEGLLCELADDDVTVAALRADLADHLGDDAP